MLHDSSGNQKNASEDMIQSHSPPNSTSENVGNGKEETSSIAPINNKILAQTAIDTTPQRKDEEVSKPSELRQNLFMVFITLTQLVQMIPLGAGINSGLAIGEALGATNIQSVWIVASYPLTQGSFVLIGKFVLFFGPFPFFYIHTHYSQKKKKKKKKFFNFYFAKFRGPSGCSLWTQKYLDRRLCVVASLGFWWRILQQPRLDVHYESSMRYWRRPDDSKYRRLVGHHLPPRKKTKPRYGSLWSNGTCRRSWRFSHLRRHHPIVRVEMVVLYAVRNLLHFPLSLSLSLSLEMTGFSLFADYLLFSPPQRFSRFCGVRYRDHRSPRG